MEKVRPRCGQPSDRERLKNRTEQIELNILSARSLPTISWNCRPNCAGESLRCAMKIEFCRRRRCARYVVDTLAQFSCLMASSPSPSSSSSCRGTGERVELQDRGTLRTPASMSHRTISIYGMTEGGGVGRGLRRRSRVAHGAHGLIGENAEFTSRSVNCMLFSPCLIVEFTGMRCLMQADKVLVFFCFNALVVGLRVVFLVPDCGSVLGFVCVCVCMCLLLLRA